MAHRKPPERSQAGATGKELKKNCFSHSKGAGIGEHTAIFGLSKEVLEKITINFSLSICGLDRS